MSVASLRWSNKFEVENSSQVDKELNIRLRKIISLKTLGYKQNKTKIISALKNKKYVAYQTRLLKYYFQKYPEKIPFDCDYLSIVNGLDLSPSSILNADMLLRVSPKALKSVLSVRKDTSRNVNYGRNESRDVIYDVCYRFELLNDPRKRLQLYVSSTNNSVKIDFIPTRFSLAEIELIFSHIKSWLTTRRYEQFINNAHIERIDIAFNIVGLFQPMVLPDYRFFNNTKHGQCFPEQDGTLVETTYINRHRNSNHYIIYDKILKEVKWDIQKFGIPPDEAKELINSLAMTTRFEYRFKPSRSGGMNPLLLKSIDAHSPEFHNIRLFDPEIFTLLNDDDIYKLATDKSIKVVNNLITKGRLNPDRYYVYSLYKCRSTVKDSIKHVLFNLRNSIVSASKPKATDLEQYRRQKLVSPKQIPLPTDKTLKGSEAYLHSNHLVIAGAGSGKTSQIVDHVNNLVDVKDKKANKIVVLAYTNIAANELKNRISNQDVVIQTFSSWCRSWLVKLNQYKGLKVLDSKDKEAYFKYWLKKNKVKQSEAEKYIHFFAYCAQDSKKTSNKKLIDQFKVDEKLSIKLEKSYICYKKENSVWDFEDMLAKMLKELKNKKFLQKVKKETKHLVIDEVQDSSRVQWSILKALVKEGTKYFLVGDPCQSIYMFRGAKPELMYEFQGKFSKTKFSYLKRHYRSSPNLLRLTNFVRQQCDPRAVKLKTVEEEQCQPKGYRADTIEQACEALYSELLNDFKHSTGQALDILILVRTNKQVQTVQTKLKSLAANAKKRKAIKRLSSNVRTMHAAKGLESEVCYVLDPRFMGKSIDTKKEYLNLMYVSLTRAKRKLVILKKNTFHHGYKDGEHFDDTNVLDSIYNQMCLCTLSDD
ncbi:ATP-dependent helicase [Catenovulum adriaticum]|uniref:DNA 3'-5' helicase n=1 Tax=Catenovulum adriaticum TaxID=2984846 RepID=A0ABY7AMK8_9ALTE|nr:ATP-dependent helicase [Catenovulum sp. TS8]WAJ69536.1 ATP-dependent helicase [Catenovulum sp. TS8]